MIGYSLGGVPRGPTLEVYRRVGIAVPVGLFGAEYRVTLRPV